MTTALRRHRRDRNWTQDDLAELLRIDQTTVSLWERGKVRPTRRHGTDLQRAFGVSIEHLLQNDDDRSPGAVATTVSPAKDSKVDHER